MGSLNMAVVELDEPRHGRHIDNLLQDIKFKRDLLQVIFLHINSLSILFYYRPLCWNFSFLRRWICKETCMTGWSFIGLCIGGYSTHLNKYDM